jgi:hypothetical protein
MEAIDLGASPKEIYGSSPTAPSGKSEEPEKIYPKFTYRGSQELDLPEDGCMEIEFCKTREVSETRDGKHYYECDIEVREIREVEDDDDDEVEAPSRSYNEAGDALDTIAKALGMAKDE